MKKLIYLYLIVSSLNAMGQDLQQTMVREISQKGFNDFDSSFCKEMISIKLSDTQAQVMNSSFHFVNKIDENHFDIASMGGRSIWYKIKPESDRDFNFSLIPLAGQQIYFVLYQVNTSDPCPNKEFLSISRAVLLDSINTQVGIGLTGESTANYNDLENLSNILHATPYHKAVFMEKETVYFLNIIVSSDNIKHSFTIGGTQISVDKKEFEAPVFKKANLKSFLNGSVAANTAPVPSETTITSNATSETVLKPVNDYDNFLYDPSKNTTKPSSGNSVALNKKENTSKNSSEKGTKNTSAKENKKENTNNTLQPQQSAASYTKPKTNDDLTGTLYSSDGTPASNVLIYITDVSMNVSKGIQSVKTNADGTFYLPISSEYVFISIDAHDSKVLNKFPLKIKGQLPESMRKTKVYGASANNDGTFNIENVTMVAYGSDELVSVADRKTSSVNLSDLTFKIQVGAFLKTKSFKKAVYQKYGQIGSYKLGDGLTRYTVGSFSSLQEAEALKQQLLSDGLEGVFIVAFQKGQRTEFR